MADKVFYNGKIYTMAGGRNAAVSAVAVAGHRIEAVGNNEEILKLAQEGCEKIDLEGRCVLPAFNDSHCHVLLTGLEQEKISLRGARSLAECIRRCREYIEKNHIPAGGWIYGSGFDHNIFEDERRVPDRLDLDRISACHPIILERVCGHIAGVNDLALREVGYDAHTSVTGGVLDKDENGRLTGVLREAALDLFKQRMPKADVEGARRAILRVYEEAAACGVTSMQTDDLEGAPLETVMEAYEGLAAEGLATVRIFEEVQAARVPILRTFLEKGLRTGDGDRFFKIGNIKLLTDGSLGARTAFLREPYCDEPDSCGIAVYTQEALNEVVMEAHKARMQVACHAIGDGAAAQCIEAFGRAWESDHTDLRHRIVHCQFADDGMLADMARFHICADVQPPFVPTDYPLTASRLGSRDSGGYAWKSMLNHGIHIGGGSDSPVETFDPVWGIHCAVNRTDLDGNPPGGWHPQEKLTVEEAVSIYTAGGAYVSFEENSKGTIEPGKLADMAVLDRDIFAIPAEEIRYLRNVMTVMDGKIVHSR